MVFTAPQLEYGALAPMLIIFAAALIGVIVEAFVKSSLRSALQLTIAMGGIVLVSCTAHKKANGADCRT